MEHFRNNPISRAIIRWGYALGNTLAPRDHCDTFRPLLMCLMLIGIMPYSLVGPRGNQRLKPAIGGALITVFMICMAVYMAGYMGINLFWYWHIRPSTFSMLCETAIYTLAYIVLLTMLVRCLIRRRSFVCLVDLISTIDKRLISLNGNVRHGAALWSLIGRMLLTFILYLVYVMGAREFVAYQTQVDRIFIVLQYCMPHTIIGMFLLKWRTVLHWIHRRYKVLNQILAQLHENTNLTHDRSARKQRRRQDSNIKTDPVDKFTQTIDFTTIDTACLIHEELCDVCFLTEVYFAWMLLMIVTLAFLVILINLYFVLEVLVVSPESITTHMWWTMSLVFYQLLIYLLEILLIVYNSSAVLDENELCAINVHRLINGANTEAARQKLKVFSIQLMHRDVRLTASKVFPLDKTLIFTIIGATTTYLVIILQTMQ